MLIDKIRKGTVKIAVIGLGYVGLPLAVEFGRKFRVTGFDVNPERIARLKAGVDETLETSTEELQAAVKLSYAGDADELRGHDVYIVTVPTPVDKYNRPELAPLLKASRTVGAAMARGAVVIYESTVYPGCTEEACVPVLEEASGLVFNRDFFCGYSPERINPGDRTHGLTAVCKVTSGSNPEAAAAVDALYRSIVKAGTHLASSMKVAEAAKVIENSQRDLNIAFVNELAKIFNLIGIDTNEVLAAASTKWNFLPFKPGLVGGHCIGVDPYYLTHKAQALGYLPEVILAGRRINDGMGKYVADEILKLMIRKGILIRNAKVLQMGITFKENCPDIRNSHAVDVARALMDFGCTVDVWDPWADSAAVEKEYGFASFRELASRPNRKYDVIILAVAHGECCAVSLSSLRKKNSVVFDIKGALPVGEADKRL
jgi:UDP-N-acetyl-D-galactosamine dehydrogenase